MSSSRNLQRNLNVTYTRNPNIQDARAGAFTLVELLVVIVVIMILASLVAPLSSVATERARQSNCGEKLKNLHQAAALYGSANGNLVPLVHEATDFGAVGKILASGGRFAEKYMGQSWNGEGNKATGKYADMLKDDNVFQCPGALEKADHFLKKESTNYRLTAFGLYTGGSSGLHPSMMTIGGTVQKLAESSRGGTKMHPAGEVAMAMDWIWSRNAQGLGGFNGGSLKNHNKGANVLYGSGSVKWVNYGTMRTVPTVPGLLIPPGTYGFVKGGTNGTHIFAPCREVIKPSTSEPRKPGVGVMW
ncbi:MAG: prepilin-type N-terminal cleavage/methylation domain-containing protein [Phycisphaerae bacterium]|jgi:type II secretory pathway pseudopilin PulG|nr:prepilin-type N-terminal cleavage/methylation domain-containing protein [Phycisphaerae bacterium]